MGNVDFLNIEYILLRARAVVENYTPNFSLSMLPDQLSFWYGQFAIAGMTLSLIFLVLWMYSRIKLLATEHEGFHHMEEAEHGTHGADHEVDSKNQRWERVMTLAVSAQESDWRRAIVEADIMLGDMLTEQGYTGSSIGDQLKTANPLQFTTLDVAWKAHKVRNDIAHGGEGFHLSERDARTTIDYYARVFEEFKIL